MTDEATPRITTDRHFHRRWATCSCDYGNISDPTELEEAIQTHAREVHPQGVVR
jgi:hypothetical protein